MPKLPTLIGDPVIRQEGANVILDCVAECQPAPTAAWTKDDKEIKEGDQYTMKIEKTEGDKYKISCEIKVKCISVFRYSINKYHHILSNI